MNADVGKGNAGTTGRGRFEKILLWTAVMVCAITSFSYLLVNICMLDEGVTCMNASRIAGGEVIYRDFFQFITPLSFMITGFLYKVFGVSFLAGRIFALSVSLLYLAFVFLVSKKILGDDLFSALSVAVLCQAGFVAWPYPSHHTLANLFAIISVFFLLRTPSRLNFFLFGGFSALTFWSLQDEGAYLILASLVFLVFVSRKKEELAFYAAGGAAFSLPIAAYLIAFVPAGSLYRCLFAYPFAVYHTNPGNKFDLMHPVKGIIEAWTSGQFRSAPVYTPVATLTSSFIVLAPFIAAVLLFMVFYRNRGEKRTNWAMLIFFASLFGTALHRFAPINLMFASAAPVLIILYYFSGAGNPPHAKARFARPAATVLTLCFVCVGLATLYRTVKPGSLTPLETVSGTVYTMKPAQARCIRELIDKIEENVPPGKTLVTRELPLVNFAVGRPNAVDIDFFQPPYETPEEWTKEAMAKMERKGIRWVATYRVVSARSVFDEYLDANFEPFFMNDQFILWKRKDPGAPPNGGA